MLQNTTNDFFSELEKLDDFQVNARIAFDVGIVLM